MKLLAFFLIAFTCWPSYATDERENNEFIENQKLWLETDIRDADYIARLEAISYFILENISKLKAESHSYYNYVKLYKVLESFKGDLPEYILIKGFAEYYKKYKGNRYGINDRKTIIRAFCKGTNHYYFPSTHYLYGDTPALRYVASQGSQRAEVSQPNKCDTDHWLSR